MPYEKGVRLMPHIRLSEATLRVNRRWREANATIMLLGNGESKRFGRRFFPIVLLVRPRWYVWYEGLPSSFGFIELRVKLRAR